MTTWDSAAEELPALSLNQWGERGMSEQNMADNRTLRRVVERALEGSGASVAAVDQVVSEINDSLWLAVQRMAVAEEIALNIEGMLVGLLDGFQAQSAAAAKAREVGGIVATR